MPCDDIAEYGDVDKEIVNGEKTNENFSDIRCPWDRPLENLH